MFNYVSAFSKLDANRYFVDFRRHMEIVIPIHNNQQYTEISAT